MTSGQGAFIVLPSARQHLRRVAEFLGQQNPARAMKFLEAARSTMLELADAPFLGSPRPQDDPRLHFIRRWPVKGFVNTGFTIAPSLRVMASKCSPCYTSVNTSASSCKNRSNRKNGHPLRPQTSV